MSARAAYSEYILTKETREFHAQGAEVSVDADGYFVNVEQCSIDSGVMMTLPLAVKVHRALGRAIRAAREARNGARART